MLEFKESSLKVKLGRLPAASRVAFAVSCAQRLAGAYRAFATEHGQVETIATVNDTLEFIWNHILTDPEDETIEHVREDIMALLPNEDAAGWTPLTAYIENALSAVAYCLRCMQSGDPKEAVWAARQVFDALDQFVIRKNNVWPSERSEEVRILSDAVIQTELERQARDLAELGNAADDLSDEVLNILKERSKLEQAITLP